MKILLIITLIAISSTTWAANSLYLTYDDLIRQVEAGNIKSVTLDDFSSIEGTILDGSSTKDFKSYAKTGTANDPLLNRFLKEHNVSISMRDKSQPSYTMPMLTGFMFLLAPVAFLILLIVIIRKLNHVLANQKHIQPPAEVPSPPNVLTGG